MKITSLQNRQVKNVVKLRSRSERDRQGILLIEGLRAVERADAASWHLETLYYCPTLFNNQRASRLLQKIRNSPIDTIECTQQVFTKMAYRKKPEGLLALGKQAGTDIANLELPDNPLVLVAEGVEKPGNLGSLLRIADAAGVDALLLCNGRTDVNNPNVVRSSVGTIFSVPIGESSSRKAMDWLQDKDITTVAAMPEAERDYFELDLSQRGLAIAVGAEQPGLSEIWERESTCRARIPMAGLADSLNVSVSAAVLLYEAVGQISLP